MKRTVFIIFAIASLLLSACSERGDNVVLEQYRGDYMCLYPGSSVVTEFYTDWLLEYLPHTVEDLGEGDSLLRGTLSESEKETYDLAIRESDALLTIKKEATKEERFLHTQRYKYTFEPGVYMDGLTEVRKDMILFDGRKNRDLDDYVQIRQIPYGEEYIVTTTETDEYKGVFSVRRYGNFVELKNDEYTYEIEYVSGGCKLTRISPEGEYVVTLDRYE